MTEVTPVALVYQNEQDYQRGIITMLTRNANGLPIVHRKIERAKIIDGNDLIISVTSEEDNGKDIDESSSDRTDKVS